MFGRKVTCAKRRCAYNQYAVCKCNVLHINQAGECDMYKNELEGSSRPNTCVDPSIQNPNQC